MNQTKEETIVTATIEAKALRALLSGALTHSSKDESLLALYGVYLSREEGRIVARATDRFRLIVGSIESEGEGESAPIRLPYNDTKALVSTLTKATRWEKATLTLAGDIVSVTISGSTLTFSADANTRLPDHAHLFPSDMSRAIDFPYVSLNPSFFADYAKIVGKKGQVVITQYKADHAYSVDLKGELDSVEWKALLMPMRNR